MSETSDGTAIAGVWPALPLDSWRETYAALHLRTQMLGKTRLALSPPENHWWHAALYVTPRGLTTSAMPVGTRTLEVEMDLQDARLVARTSDGRAAELPLRAQSTRGFFADYRALLASLGVAVRLWPGAQESAPAVRLDEDDGNAAFDAEAAQRCWQVLVQVDRLLKRFRGGFAGKCSPSHFWWGAFDLACTRFSGARAPRHPGGMPRLADRVAREAYSHACISAGWWPGTPGMFEEPAFYAYVYPEPPGCPEASVGPAGARYDPTLREWVLPYEAVRTASDPDATLREFLQSTYEAAATLAGWDRAALERPAVAVAELA